VSELPPEQPQAQPAPAVEPGADHPIQVLVDDDCKRSRLTVFFRLILAIPHFIWITLWSIAAFIVGFVGWLIAIFTGRLPEGIHGFLASYLIYSTRFNGYWNLLANPYPPFHGRDGGSYPVDLRVDPLEKQRRWTILLRVILGIPAMILAWVFGQVMGIIAFLGWFVCIVIGRMPKGMRDLGVYCLRYQQQTYGYLMILTERYPSLAGPTP
jgi:uncharacterized membrane protein YhdT